MLHQPTTTFEPSCKPPAFDPAAYIDHMRNSGLTIYPVLTHAGRRTFGVNTPDDRTFYAAHEVFREAYDQSWYSPSLIFRALCDAHGLDPDANDFNQRVGTMFDREDHTCADDKSLMARCRAAIKVLAKDHAATDHCSEVEDKMQVWAQLHQPTRPSVFPDRPPCPEDSASVMRKRLAEMKGCNTREVIESYRARIEAVVAFERAYKAFDREIGCTRARKVSSALIRRSEQLIGEIAGIRAMTMAGMAAKADALSAWRKAGYGLDDEGAELALSIAEDARTLGASGQAGHRAPPRRSRRSTKPNPLAQVH